MRKQIQNDIKPQNVKVNVKVSVSKLQQVKWITYLCDKIKVTLINHHYRLKRSGITDFLQRDIC